MIQKDNKEKRASVVALLLDAGVNYIGCRYNGGGDDGSIEEVLLCNQMNEDMIETGLIDWNHELTEADLPDTQLYSDIHSKVEDLFYPHLNNIEDWWNNDGGYGSAVIALNTMKITIDNNCYRTETDSFMHEMFI